MNDYGLEIILFLAGALVSVLVPLLPARQQKWIAFSIALSLAAVSLVLAVIELATHTIPPLVSIALLLVGVLLVWSLLPELRRRITRSARAPDAGTEPQPVTPTLIVLAQAVAILFGVSLAVSATRQLLRPSTSVATPVAPTKPRTPTAYSTTHSIPSPSPGPTHSPPASALPEKRNWVLPFEYSFPPDQTGAYWSEGPHQYTISLDCSGTARDERKINPFVVATDVPLYPGYVYLRADGLFLTPLGYFAPLESINPRQPSIAAITLEGMTFAESQLTAQECEGSLSWDDNAPSRLIPGQPYQPSEIEPPLAQALSPKWGGRLTTRWNGPGHGGAKT